MHLPPSGQSHVHPFVSTGGGFVDLVYPPQSMYVLIDERHPGRPSMSDTMDIIALVPVSDTFELKDYFQIQTAKGKNKNPSLTVKFQDFQFKSTLACTYYGVEGHTVPRLIMCVDEDQVPKFSYTDLYVGLTRVKDPDHIRCISFRSAIRNRAYLQNLEVNAYVESYFTGVPAETIIGKRTARKVSRTLLPKIIIIITISTCSGPTRIQKRPLVIP